MRNGKCARCGSATVYWQADGVIGAGGWGPKIGSIHTPLDVVSFVCVTCGYFENYAADPGKLATVQQRWRQAPVVEQ